MSGNGQYQEGIESFLRTIATAPDENRLAVFRMMAREAVSLARKADVPLADAIDRLQDQAIATDLVEVYGQDEIQAALAAAANGLETINLPHDGANGNGAANVSIPDFPHLREPKQRKQDKAERPAQIVLEYASDVEAHPVEWLWSGRIARRKITLLAGAPGIGKSQISIDIAARISAGARWPDQGRAPSGSVIILSAEDSADDTIRPRLEAAGAELTKVAILKSVTEATGRQRTFSLQADLDALGQKIAEIGDASIVIIDPVTSYMGLVDSHRTTDVRAILEPLDKFAARFNVAVIAISHPPKSPQSNALHAVTGSLAFVAAPRLVFIAIEEAETSRRLLLPAKNNLGPFAPGLGFRLAQTIVCDSLVASHVEWDSAPVTVTANEALALSANAGKQPTPRDEAAAFLREMLADGPRPQTEIEEAAKDQGHSWRTVRRAKTDLQVESDKDGIGGGWVWSLPKRATWSSSSP
jgi:putative DNA primase/helicase